MKKVENKIKNKKFESNNNINLRKSIVNDYSKFYKKNILKKHSICFIIFLVLFIIFLLMGFKKDINVDNIAIPSFFNSLIKQKFIAGFVLIFAGIVPYFYMSVLGFAFSSELAMTVIAYYKISSSIPGLIANIFGCLIICIAYSYAIAVGFYYCALSTKRFKYNQGRGFSFLDVKRSIANIRRDEEKVNEYNIEEEKRREKIEKFNIKVDYKNIIVSYIIIDLLLLISNIFIR